MRLTTALRSKYKNRKEQKAKQKRHKLGIDAVISHENAIKDLYIPAVITHQKVFPKYRGINKGKVVVLLGTAPTFDYYTPLEGAIHIGMNRAFMREDIPLDYLFRCDKESDEIEKLMSEYKGNSCKKLYGYRYRCGKTIPMYRREEENVESFYCLSYDYSIHGTKIENEQFFIFPPDISVSPFKSYGTTMFIAFQFALWTHPDKIFLVGCDCSSGHSTATKDDKVFDYSYLINPWKKAKQFADEYYPDIEITSINPVGLKGIFNDIYTDSYKESLLKK